MQKRHFKQTKTKAPFDLSHHHHFRKKKVFKKRNQSQTLEHACMHAKLSHIII